MVSKLYKKILLTYNNHVGSCHCIVILKSIFELLLPYRNPLFYYRFQNFSRFLCLPMNAWAIHIRSEKNTDNQNNLCTTLSI